MGRFTVFLAAIALTACEFPTSQKTEKAPEPPPFVVRLDPPPRRAPPPRQSVANRLQRPQSTTVVKAAKNSLADLVGASKLDFSPDGAQLVTLGPEAKLQLWDAETSELERILSVRGEPIAVRMVEGNRLIVLCRDRVVVLDTVAGRKLHEIAPLGAKQFICESIGATYHGEYVVFAVDHSVGLLNLQSGTTEIYEYGNFTLFLRCSPQQLVAILSKTITPPQRGTIKATDEDVGLDRMDLLTGKVDAGVYQPSKDHPWSPASVAFSRDGRQVFISTYAGPVVVTAANWQVERTIEPAEPDEFYLYSKLVVSDDGTLVAGIPVHLGDGRPPGPPEFAVGEATSMTPLPATAAADIAISATGRVAVAQKDGPVKLIEPTTDR